MILVTGARGQIGTDLAAALRQRHGVGKVVESDLRGRPDAASDGPFEILDVTDAAAMNQILDRHRVDTVYHLASLLSARGEENPDLCWQINMQGLRNVLEAARSRRMRVFWPSSIAVFGPRTPKRGTPQMTVEDPSTMYGITKVAGELLSRYYALRFGVDVRSLRLPGIISYSSPPGGGTTDFAVEIFHEALKKGSYVCFVRPDTRLPMMYMPDTIRAILDLMAAPSERITIRSSYNLSAVSFSAQELVEEIQRQMPGFTCSYTPDSRQAIADSWPSEIDDAKAREDWGWRHSYDLPALVRDMLEKLPAYL